MRRGNRSEMLDIGRSLKRAERLTTKRTSSKRLRASEAAASIAVQSFCTGAETGFRLCRYIEPTGIPVEHIPPPPWVWSEGTTVPDFLSETCTWPGCNWAPAFRREGIPDRDHCADGMLQRVRTSSPGKADPGSLGVNKLHILLYPAAGLRHRRIVGNLAFPGRRVHAEDFAPFA